MFSMFKKTNRKKSEGRIPESKEATRLVLTKTPTAEEKYAKKQKDDEILNESINCTF